MEARVHQTTAEFRAVAWPFLAADPAKYTVILTAVAHPLSDSSLLITLHDKENLVGALVQTQSYPLVVTAVPPDAAGFAARTVHDLMPDLSAVTGTEAEVEAFARSWTELTGKTATRSMAIRLFELDELRPPEVEGEPRQATEDDIPLLTDWYGRFMAEALPTQANPVSADSLAKASLEEGAFAVFWETNGVPVSVAGGRGPVSGMSRIAPVYTPHSHRGHGYASAVTAAATQIALDRGSGQVLISTDLANPTTNRIYPAIGYEAVSDSAEYRFG